MKLNVFSFVDVYDTTQKPAFISMIKPMCEPSHFHKRKRKLLKS